MRTDILGVAFDGVTPDEAVQTALRLMERRDGAYAVTPNPEIVWAARDDEALRAALNGAALVLPDGVGITYAARILGTPLPARVPGIDFASALMAELAKTGGSVYLFGAKPGIADAAAETLIKAHPGLVIAGTDNGYFTDDGDIKRRIAAARPDLLLVCLGSPKQESWMVKNAPDMGAGLMIGLGGSLDVFAGAVKRAPAAWQRLGLEWLYRLIKEPRRIKRMAKLPLFLFAAVSRRLK